MKDLSHWDKEEEFSPLQAAALIEGFDPDEFGDVVPPRVDRRVARLKEGHRVAIALVAQPVLTRAGFVLQRAQDGWSNALISMRLNFYAGYQPTQWFRGPDGDFEQQRFARMELHRWLGAVGLKSIYSFEIHTNRDLPVPPTHEDASMVAVRADGAGALPVEQGLLTADIATIFDGLNGWSYERWRKNLSNSKWLHHARIGMGKAGGASAMWSPLVLAQLMYGRAKGDKGKTALMKALNSRFNLNPALKPWRDGLNEYFATYGNTE